jgi:hypothetical protein
VVPTPAVVVSHGHVALPRPVPPSGVIDFDFDNKNDPCSEYAMEIFQYYKSREVRTTLFIIEGIKIRGR